MIFRIAFGSFWNRYYLAAREHGEEMHAIIANLSTPYFGSYARERHGGICLPIMETGKIHIAVFADGGIKAFGKRSWKD